MNTLKKTYRIPKDRELKIKLPVSFEVDKKVIVAEEKDISAKYKKKVELMKKAASDPLFQEDVKIVMDDFSNIDFESLK